MHFNQLVVWSNTANSINNITEFYYDVAGATFRTKHLKEGESAVSP